MKRFIAILCAGAAFLLVVAGCEARIATPTESGAEAKGDTFFYDESTGRVVTDLSDRFDFKIEQWKLSFNEEAGQERLLFGVTIKNKTQTRLKNFNGDIRFDDKLLYLFVTGLTNYDQYEPVDLIPGVTANGVSYSADISVNTADQVKENGYDKDQLLETARFVTLKLSWDGGEETVTLDCGRPGTEEHNEVRLTAENLLNIALSAPEGSGGIRTMTLYYMKDGKEYTDILDDISSIDSGGYDDEAKEQTLTDSDSDGDGIVDFIIYREFWFPDLDMAHAEVPRWPTVYEYDLHGGFVIASAKHRAYFETYAKQLKDKLDTDMDHMSDAAILAVKRLKFAAERIADGAFAPSSPYGDQCYADVCELTKGIIE